MPFLFSCVNSRKATYFNDLGDNASFATIEIPEPIIQQNDLLSITVSSLNPEASRIFNLPNQSEVRSSTPTGDVMEPAGYLVDKDGMIRFLMLGAVKAEGLTKSQLQNNLRNALLSRKLLVDPVVEVRFLNFRVTVLGEVTRPTVITVPGEKISLLEALGLAGDVTIYGKRDNVLVIREEAGKRITTRVNLNSNEIFTSPYYYLRSNDIVYIEPNKARVAGATRLNQLLPALISALSVVVIVVDRLAQ
ncbi:polysaccharide biosynthesis/export family protein [Rufibacter tibetensis]|uniref:polysaccharide biosynthesis/export family protein n=1 Tax=Rufibacter tibetensis TaxID=512763 RepID=UPI001FE1BB85|nr:polysaccharide biosynthesis/export family protein [Rufibacter tibetensis]